jgi:hypothetical protein
LNGLSAAVNGRSFFNGNLPRPSNTSVPIIIEGPLSPENKPDFTLRNKVQEAVPGNRQPLTYRDEYLVKVTGTDGQHVCNRHSIEIVVDNGAVFPLTSGDGRGGALLVQQLGKHHGTDGVFEIIVRDGIITHQRFVPGGTITGNVIKDVPNVSGSVGPGPQWWK